MGAGLAAASGLYYERPSVEEKSPPPVERKEDLGAKSGLHDVRISLALRGVAPDDMGRATTITAGVLERRAAGLAKKWKVDTDPRGVIDVYLYGCSDPARALQVLTTPGRLVFYAVAEGSAFRARAAAAGWASDRFLPYEHGNLLLISSEDRDDFNRTVAGVLNEGELLVWGRPISTGTGQAFPVALTTGDKMVVSEAISAAAVAAASGEARVDFRLGAADGVNFAGLTARHIGDALAVVFDGDLLYTARVKEQAQEEVTIYGDLDLEYASVIALLLESGALPVTLQPVEYSVDGVRRTIPAL